MAATIRQISEAALVSPSTVSRVLSGKGRIAPATRERVEAAARELSYHPRSVGRPTKAAAAYHIGMAYPKHPRAGRKLAGVLAQWMLGARRSLVARGHNFSTFVGSHHIDEDLVLQQLVKNGELDGLILMGFRPADGYLPWALRTRLPLVVVNRRPQHEQFSYVGMDNFGGGRLAAEHLCQLGHERFAYVDFPEQQTHHIDRQAGFVQGLRDHGFALDAFYQIDPDNPDTHAMSTADAVRDIRRQNVTAVFCFNDTLAYAMAEEMRRQQLSVPEQCSLVGFDHRSDVGEWEGRCVTAVACSAEQIGNYAAQMALDLIEQRHVKPFLACTVPAELIEHDTTGPPPRP